MANISGLFRSIYGGSLGNTAGAIDAARAQQDLERAKLQTQLQAESMQSARTAALNELLMRSVDTGLGAWQRGAELDVQKEQNTAANALRAREIGIHEAEQKRIAAKEALERQTEIDKAAANTAALLAARNAAVKDLLPPSMAPKVSAAPQQEATARVPPPPLLPQKPAPDAETMAAIGGKPIDQAALQAELDKLPKPTADMRTAPRDDGADMPDEMAAALLAKIDSAGIQQPTATAVERKASTPRADPLSVSPEEVDAFVQRFAQENPDEKIDPRRATQLRGFFAAALVEARRNYAAKALENVADKQRVLDGARKLDHAAIETTIKGTLGLAINDIKDIGNDNWNALYDGINARMQSNNDSWAEMSDDERESLAKTLALAALRERKKADSDLANDAITRARIAQQIEDDKKKANAIGSSEYKAWDMYLKGKDKEQRMAQSVANQIRSQLYDPVTGSLRLGLTTAERESLESRYNQAVQDSQEKKQEFEQQNAAFALAVQMAQQSGIPLAAPQGVIGRTENNDTSNNDKADIESKIKSRARELIQEEANKGKTLSVTKAIQQASAEMGL